MGLSMELTGSKSLLVYLPLILSNAYVEGLKSSLGLFTRSIVYISSPKVGLSVIFGSAGAGSVASVASGAGAPRQGPDVKYEGV